MQNDYCLAHTALVCKNFNFLFEIKPTKRQWKPDQSGIKPWVLQANLQLVTLLSHWDFSQGEIQVAIPRESQLWYSRYPCWVFLRVCVCVCVCVCFHNPPNSDMDYRIFNVHTHVNACDCTQGCMDFVRACTQSWLWEKNPLLHQGIEPASVACWSDTLPTELHPSPSCYLYNVCFLFLFFQFHWQEVRDRQLHNTDDPPVLCVITRSIFHSIFTGIHPTFFSWFLIVLFCLLFFCCCFFL